MLFTIFVGIAQFERDLTSERTQEGILAVRKRGKYPGRPKTMRRGKLCQVEHKIIHSMYRHASPLLCEMVPWFRAKPELHGLIQSPQTGDVTGDALAR